MRSWGSCTTPEVWQSEASVKTGGRSPRSSAKGSRQLRNRVLSGEQEPTTGIDRTRGVRALADGGPRPQHKVPAKRVGRQSVAPPESWRSKTAAVGPVWGSEGQPAGSAGGWHRFRWADCRVAPFGVRGMPVGVCRVVPFGDQGGAIRRAKRRVAPIRVAPIWHWCDELR